MKRLSWRWTAQVVVLGLMMCPAVSSAQWKLSAKKPLFGPKQKYCPPAPAPYCPPAPVATEPAKPESDVPPAPMVEGDKPATPMDPSTTTPQNQQPSQDQQQPQQDQQQPQLDIPQAPAQVTGSTGTNAAPDMIGDFFGLGGVTTTFNPGFNGFGGSVSGGVGTGNLILDPVNNTMFFVNGSTASAAVNAPLQFQNANGDPLVPGIDGVIADLSGFQPGPNGTQQVEGIFTARPTGDVIGTVTTPNGVVNNAVVYNIQQDLNDVSSPNAASQSFGKLKIAEGTSPIPRDRFIFNYSYFDNATVLPTGVDVSRFSPGFEKTFWNQQASFQLQTPFSSTLQNDVAIGSNGSLIGSNDVVFGDMTMVFKGVLMERCNFLMSAGLQMTVPTSDDRTVSVVNPFDATDRRLFAVLESQSVHLMPFIGGVYNRDRWFIQSVMQLDFDTNGETLRVNRDVFGDDTLSNEGRIQEPTYIFLDVSVAYQIYRAKCNRGWGIASIAPMVELHYNRSLTEADGVTVIDDVTGFNYGTFGAEGEDFESLNAVAGTAILMKKGGAWLIGYGTPIAGGQDREFDGELRVFYSYRFGGKKSQCDDTGMGYGNYRGGNLRTGIF